MFPLILILLFGDLMLIARLLSLTLPDNSIEWIIILPAIAMDLYIAYKIVKDKFEAHRQKQIVEASKRVSEIVSFYTPLNAPSVQEAKTLKAAPYLVNREMVFTVEEHKKKLLPLLNRLSDVNSQLKNMLSCHGCTTAEEKDVYLSSKIDIITQLKSESDKLYMDIFKEEIEIPNEDGVIALMIKTSFHSLLYSKKCSSDEMNIKDFVCQDVPIDLSLFRYEYTPVTLFLNDFYFCLFSGIILAFDNEGLFSTALDPTALLLKTYRATECIKFSNGVPFRQRFTDVDSKLVQEGNTEVAWTYPRNSSGNSSFLHREYDNNYQVEYKRNYYGYSIIHIKLCSFSISYTASAYDAVDYFDALSEKYIKSRINS